MHIQQRSWLVRPAVALLLTCSLLASACWGQVAKDTVAVEKPVAKSAVALFTGNGARGKGPGMLTETFGELADFDFHKITVDEICAGKLADYRILIVPGGSSREMGKALGDPGRAAIREFVKQGGTYVGICAGCYLSSCHYDWSLHILPAKVVDSKNRYRGKASLQLEPSDAGKEWLRREALDSKTIYHNGPVLEPLAESEQELIPLAYFREEISRNAPKGLMVNTPAIAASVYGDGWVVGISPHPEQTEGQRDLVPSLVRWAIGNPHKN